MSSLSANHELQMSQMQSQHTIRENELLGLLREAESNLLKLAKGS